MTTALLRVGDRLPAPPSILCDPEASSPAQRRRRWHALRVVPQREAAVRHLLARQGVGVSFYPVEMRVTVCMGRRRETERRFLPGLVFALFPREVVWHRLLACPERPDRPVRDVLRLASGEPARIVPRDVRGLWEMRSRSEAAARERRVARSPRKGGRARIVSGPFGGQVVEVCELRAGEAVVRLRLFGAEIEARVGEGMLMAVGE